MGKYRKIRPLESLEIIGLGTTRVQTELNQQSRAKSLMIFP